MNFLHRLSVKRYYKYKEEVGKRNDIAGQTFLMVGIIVALVNLLSNMFIKRTNGYAYSFVLLGYFVGAYLVRLLFIKDRVRKSTLFLYIIQLPVMIVGILMGTYFDPGTVTITFFLLIVCMPPFILDNPVRHLCYILLMMATYVVFGFLFKDPEIFKYDLVHALGFLMGGMFLNLFVLAERTLPLYPLQRLSERMSGVHLRKLRV